MLFVVMYNMPTLNKFTYTCYLYLTISIRYVIEMHDNGHMFYPQSN